MLKSKEKTQIALWTVLMMIIWKNTSHWEMDEKPSQVRKAMADLFDTFDKTPFLPKKHKKGKGRKTRTKRIKRTRHKTFKKN